ncbi:hypothetical protein J1N35_037150 [Gossypium stocksii]|uniref:RNase H type-1 domain-containing protein n=1 Tax=Gossypium stocksii TaxID=47602 RepID=A0A9D3ZKM4_9ROSI|nr:hypothetical protein J1N35_037150 [Gossypium stocksii]
MPIECLRRIHGVRKMKYGNWHENIRDLRGYGSLFGGVLRDDRGEWLLGFKKCLVKCSIFYAKLWGILDCLSLLQGKQCERVLKQMDSLEVFEAIQDSNSRSSCSTLVRLIRQLLDTVRKWRLDHIPRDGNKEAYQMAKMAFDREGYSCL